MNNIQLKILDILRDIDKLDDIVQIEDMLDSIEWKMQQIGDLPIPTDRDEDEWFQECYLTLSVLKTVRVLLLKYQNDITRNW